METTVKALKTKIPDIKWLDHIKKYYYYKDGSVYSKKSKYKKAVGSKHSSNYYCVNIETKKLTPRHTICVKLHHLVWFLNTGEWSSVELDHIDRNLANNSFENLRQSNRSEQALNRSYKSGRTYEDRYIYKIRNYYSIRKSNKVLGKFLIKEEAIKFRNDYGL